MTARAQPISEKIAQHVSADNITISLTRFGERYYVECVGPLGRAVTDSPLGTLDDAKANFAALTKATL